MKKRLVSVLEETSATQIRRLLGSHEIGDEKSSVFLQRLRNLAMGQVTDEILRTIFMEQLLENVRAILAISEVKDLGKLAAQADKVTEMAKSYQAATQAVEVKTKAESSEVEELRKQIEKLDKLVRERQRSRSRGRGEFRRRRSLPRKNENPEYCYYHRKFGDKAYKCEAPCKWSKNKESEN